MCLLVSMTLDTPKLSKTNPETRVKRTKSVHDPSHVDIVKKAAVESCFGVSESGIPISFLNL